MTRWGSGVVFAAAAALALKLFIIGLIFVLVELCALIRRYELAQRSFYVFAGRIAITHEGKKSASTSVFLVNDAVSTAHSVCQHFELVVS